ncbi:MAG: hypothetical protein EOP54_08340 [Sphingobacteriales bacterium]|nr:MAG: hypothetical protein EOP54_08340 [Sphingobacteriales bacterium]
MEVSWDIIEFAGMIIMILVFVLFLLHLQDTVKAADPENRKLKAGTIWLQLIPLLGIVYSFIVAIRLSDTIVAEYRAKDQALPVKRPTYNTGITLAVFSVITSVLEFFPKLTINELEQLVYAEKTGVLLLSIIIMFTDILWFVIWIIYWVQTTSYKKKMKKFPDQLPRNSIFNHS